MRDTNKTEVTVYKGDEVLVSGTIRHCAKQLGIKTSSLYYYLMPAYQRKVAKRRKPQKAGVRQVVEI